jgi:integrase
MGFPDHDVEIRKDAVVTPGPTPTPSPSPLNADAHAGADTSINKVLRGFSNGRDQPVSVHDLRHTASLLLSMLSPAGKSRS